jgi:hypothetical protein
VSRVARASLLLPLVALPPLELSASEPEKDSCVDCHSDPDLLVKNKKLYDYFQEWNASVHKQEDVSCSDCHGGNPEADDKDAAHGGELTGSAASSPVNFRNIPGTCGECHDEIYGAFRKSRHFEQLLAKEQEEQGPTCVTCHGSINVAALDVITVRQACARCHNDETGNHPDIPLEAEGLLNGFRSIHRFYRYIGVKGDQEKSREFFGTVDPRIHALAVNWHSFDLESIAEQTDWVLLVMKVKRDAVRAEVRARSAVSEKPSGQPQSTE